MMPKPKPIDLSLMAGKAKEASILLKMFANEHRLLVLCALMERELSVGELNEVTPLSQSALSQHLASLRDADLVKTRREAQTIFYSLNGNESVKIIEVLHSIYCADL